MSAVLGGVLFCTLWILRGYQTQATIDQINKAGICSVLSMNSDSGYTVQLSSDGKYNVEVLEALAGAYFGPFVEMTVLDVSSDSIPDVALHNVSEVHISGAPSTANDVAKLASAFPNCHIWKFPGLQWSEATKQELGGLPTESAVFVQTRPPMKEGNVTNIGQTSVFWQ